MLCGRGLVLGRAGRWRELSLEGATLTVFAYPNDDEGVQRILRRGRLANAEDKRVTYRHDGNRIDGKASPFS